MDIERLSILEDGSIVEYHLCNSDPFATPDMYSNKFTYLGKGKIYSIGGKVRLNFPTDDMIMFWKKK